MRWCLPLALLGVLAASPANAGPILFTDRAAFEAAVSDPLTLETFDERPPCTVNSAYVQTCHYDDVLQIREDFSGIAVGTQGQQLTLGMFLTGVPSLTALQPFTAFGLDITPLVPLVPGGGPAAAMAAVTIYGLPLTLTLSQPQFIGLLFPDLQPAGVSLISVNSVHTATANGFSRAAIDNVAIAVPEPASWLLVALGNLSVLLVRARTNKQTNRAHS